MLVSLEVSEGNYIDARTVLAAINQSGTIEDQNYFDLQTVIIDLEEAGTDLQNMSASQEQTVRDVANSGTLVATEAEVVLTIAFGEEFEHPIMKIQPASNKMGTQYGYWGSGEEDEDDSIEVSDAIQLKFKVYPNPNDGNMTLDYFIAEGKTAEFRLYDIMGRTHKVVQLETGQNIYRINDSSLHQGLYLYDVRVDGKVVKTDKLVILR